MNTSLQKNLIICADDYAQNLAISEGILCLAEQKRINAISCLVNSVYWGEASIPLKQVKNFVGLHLNLTFGQPLSFAWRQRYGDEFLGHANLLKKTYLRQLNIDIVAAEIRAQIEMFTQAMDAYPDFIDGHQHVHQLPIVRDALLKVIVEDEMQQLVFVRNTYNGCKDFFSIKQAPKRQLISLLGGRSLKNKFIQQAIPMNTSFAGIYSFAKASCYRTYFQQFLNQIQDGGLIMCHPGHESKDKEDPLYRSRPLEFNYLMSDVFLSDIEDNSFQLLKKVNFQ